MSTYHNCLKYIHDGIVHYVLGDDNPYSHCNIARISNEITLPLTHFFMTSLSKFSKDNDKQKILKQEKKKKQVIDVLEISSLFSKSNNSNM